MVRYLLHVLRALRNDLQDVLPGQSRRNFQGPFTFDPDSDEGKMAVFEAIFRGSKQESPFLHASRIFRRATKYLKMGEIWRGEDCSVIVRIELEGLREFENVIVVDVSTADKMDQFWFPNNRSWRYYDHKIPNFRRDWEKVGERAIKDQEVIIWPRGHIPLPAVTVLKRNGDPESPLMQSEQVLTLMLRRVQADSAADHRAHAPPAHSRTDRSYSGPHLPNLHVESCEPSAASSCSSG